MKTLHPVTRQHLEQAFEAWENRFRVDREAFRSHDEIAALPLSTVAAECADYFYELLLIQQRKFPADELQQVAA